MTTKITEYSFDSVAQESSPEFSDQEWLDIEAGVAVLLEQIKARSDWARLAKVEDLWLKVRRLNSTR